MMKWFRILLISLLILLIPGLPSYGNSSVPGTDSRLKAAIIDQLYSIYPNQPFIDETTGILEACGFSVDVWQGKDVTVSLYKELSQYGYRLIVFRAHSGILFYEEASQVVVRQSTFLFTDEAYTTTKYIGEQLSERVQNAMILENYPLVFAVNSEFITNSMKGIFDNTIIVMMGCSSYYAGDMANALIQKGASAYLGWSATVDINYVEETTLSFLKNLCIHNLPLEQAVNETMLKSGRDPYYNSRLKYFPAAAGAQTIEELLR